MWHLQTLASASLFTSRLSQQCHSCFSIVLLHYYYFYYYLCNLNPTKPFRDLQYYPVGDPQCTETHAGVETNTSTVYQGFSSRRHSSESEEAQLQFPPEEGASDSVTTIRKVLAMQRKVPPGLRYYLKSTVSHLQSAVISL